MKVDLLGHYFIYLPDLIFFNPISIYPFNFQSSFAKILNIS
jgi:hypothetical protein